MRRREFITLLSGTTVIWPIAVRAQQREQIARIGVLMGAAAEDPEGQARITAFRQGLQKLGLTEGQNVRIDIRWTGADAVRNSRPNWSRSRRTLFWPQAPDWGGVAGGNPHGADRVRSPSIRSALVSWIVWRGRAAMPPVSFVRVRHEREMARTAQGDRTRRDASGGPSGCRPRLPGPANSASSSP